MKGDQAKKRRAWNSLFFWKSKKSISSSSLPQKTPDEETGSMALLDPISTGGQRHAGWEAMPYILGNAIFERAASYGLTANFMVYLEKEYHMHQVQAATILNSWTGATNFFPLIGAFISDAYIGKYWTIVFGSIFSLLGMMNMTLTAMVPTLRPPPCTFEEQQLGQCEPYTTTQIGVLILSLLWLCLGAGGVRPCCIPFAVDQFDLTAEEGRKGTNSFFNIYYTSQTIILLITSTLVVYIQNDVSWTLGFGIPTLCMVCAILCLCFGRRMYVYVAPEGSIFSGIAQVFVAAFKKRWLQLPNDDSEGFYDPPLKSSLLQKLPLSKQHRYLNKAALIMGDEVNSDGSLVNPWRLCSTQQVEDVKCLLNIIPIWLTSIIGFLSMNQQGTFIVAQAMKMDLQLPFNLYLPAGSVSVITLVAIAIWLPLYDKYLIPVIEKITKKEGGLTLLQRIGLGNMFSVLTLLVSGFVETKRRELALSYAAPDGVAPMSIMWLGPQLILLGFAEVFQMVGLIEFYNRQFPDHMRSIGNALLYLTFSLASYCSSFMVSFVHQVTEKDGSNWLTEDVNTSKLDNFYFLMAGVSLLNFICFMFCAGRYNYKGSARSTM